MKNGAHHQYKARQVEGVDQGTLIIMLYDGAIKFLHFAIESIENNDVETAHNNIIRAQSIINELINSLKVDAGEVVVNLLRLYEFMVRQLSTANATKDKKSIKGVIGLLENLKDGWLKIIEKLKSEAGKEKVTLKEKQPEELKKVSINFSA